MFAIKWVATSEACHLPIDGWPQHTFEGPAGVRSEKSWNKLSSIYEHAEDEMKWHEDSLIIVLGRRTKQVLLPWTSAGSYPCFNSKDTTDFFLFSLFFRRVAEVLDLTHCEFQAPVVVVWSGRPSSSTLGDLGRRATATILNWLASASRLSSMNWTHRESREAMFIRCVIEVSLSNDRGKNEPNLSSSTDGLVRELCETQFRNLWCQMFCTLSVFTHYLHSPPLLIVQLVQPFLFLRWICVRLYLL